MTTWIPRAAPDAADRPALMLYCQHSLGLGHLVRSAAIAGALARRFAVTLCSGGPVPEHFQTPVDVTVVPLPPIVAGADGALQPAADGASLAETWELRRAALSDLVRRNQPAVVVVEQFPFGRRAFRSEVLQLLGAARAAQPDVRVVCSLRDLLVGGRPDQQDRDDQTSALLARHFDTVIVHADPQFARLGDTFQPTRPLAVPVHYSGFVHADAPLPTGTRSADDVLVSAGGGRVGGPLFRASVEAHRAYLRPAGMRMRIMTGPFLSEQEFDELVAATSSDDTITVQRFVPNLAAVMSRAAVSISQCGYNTALDILRSHVPAVVVPYDTASENEQQKRAVRLAALHLIDIVPADQLHARLLADAVLHRRGFRVPHAELDLDGAARTADLVEQCFRNRPELVRA